MHHTDKTYVKELEKELGAVEASLRLHLLKAVAVPLVDGAMRLLRISSPDKLAARREEFEQARRELNARKSAIEGELHKLRSADVLSSSIIEITNPLQAAVTNSPPRSHPSPVVEDLPPLKLETTTPASAIPSKAELRAIKKELKLEREERKLAEIAKANARLKKRKAATLIRPPGQIGSMFAHDTDGKPDAPALSERARPGSRM